MENSLFNSLVVIAAGVTGVALIAVLVSRNSNTAGVLTAAGNSYANALATAVSPITGGGSSISFGLPNVSGGFYGTM